MLDETARRIVTAGNIKLRVKRSGMLQILTFNIKKIGIGKDFFVELFVPRILDMSELQRVANDTHLPVEAENGRAFPEGMGAKDFMDF